MAETAIQIIRPGREPSLHYDNIVGPIGGQSNWKFYYIHSQFFFHILKHLELQKLCKLTGTALEWPAKNQRQLPESFHLESPLHLSRGKRQ